MNNLRFIFLLGGVALLIVGAINSNAVWVPGLVLILLSLISGAKSKKDQDD